MIMLKTNLELMPNLLSCEVIGHTSLQSGPGQVFRWSARPLAQVSRTPPPPLPVKT